MLSLPLIATNFHLVSHHDPNIPFSLHRYNILHDSQEILFSHWNSTLKLNVFFLSLFHSQIANNPCANLLTAHFRLDGHPNVNYLEKVIQNSSQSYLFFEPSQVKSRKLISLAASDFAAFFFYRVISIHMFASASAYVKTKLADSFVRCAKSSRRVMNRELCCVISSLESSSSQIVKGESKKKGKLSIEYQLMLPTTFYNCNRLFILSLIALITESICQKRRLIAFVTKRHRVFFLLSSFDIENKNSTDMLKFMNTHTIKVQFKPALVALRRKKKTHISASQAAPIAFNYEIKKLETRNSLFELRLSSSEAV